MLGAFSKSKCFLDIQLIPCDMTTSINIAHFYTSTAVVSSSYFHRSVSMPCKSLSLSVNRTSEYKFAWAHLGSVNILLIRIKRKQRVTNCITEHCPSIVQSIFHRLLFVNCYFDSVTRVKKILLELPNRALNFSLESENTAGVVVGKDGDSVPTYGAASETKKLELSNKREIYGAFSRKIS